MPINILMPALSPTMEKGNLAKWLKKEGETIKTGDVIAEIETDKATMEYEAIEDGVLAKIVVPEGTSDVPVNQLIAVMAQEGEDPKAAASAAAEKSPQGRAPSSPPSPAREKGLPRKRPRHRMLLQHRPPQNRRPSQKRKWLPLPLRERVGMRERGLSVHPPPTAARTASSPRHSPAASPRTQASISAASAAPARMDA